MSFREDMKGTLPLFVIQLITVLLFLVAIFGHAATLTPTPPVVNITVHDAAGEGFRVKCKGGRRYLGAERTLWRYMTAHRFGKAWYASWRDLTIIIDKDWSPRMG